MNYFLRSNKNFKKWRNINFYAKYIVIYITNKSCFWFTSCCYCLDETHVNFFRKKDINRIFKKFNQDVNFYNSTFSLNPFKPKSKLRVKSISLFGGLDDSFIFTVRVEK